MKKLTIIMGCSVLTACAPMEQVPLVYSSKNIFGVSLNSGSAEQPGLDVTIGYKGLDAAYVPVAVAKACPKELGEHCIHSMFEMKPLTGVSNEAGRQSADNSRIDRLTADVRDAKKAAEDKEREAAELRTLLKANDDQRVGLADLVMQRDALAAAEQNDANRKDLEDRQQKIAAISKLEPAKDTQKRIDDLEKQAHDARGAEARDAAQLGTLLAIRQVDRQGTFTDAYSVYGSFGGSASGGTKAELSLGKTFSTGIAAQNISRGIATSAGTVQCLNALMAFAREAGGKKTEIMAMADQICAAEAAQ